ncbi:MAG: hypothetical protein EB102_06745, partial [Gammaproteobacteria bacterium]|nr:hypothetical protein [Gammaproteobacteria bacterium]
MRELGFIDTEAERRAAAEKIFARVHVQSFEVEAPYVAEMARLELVQRLEEIALKDDYFISRKLYPNVDFYSGIIY